MKLLKWLVNRLKARGAHALERGMLIYLLENHDPAEWQKLFAARPCLVNEELLQVLVQGFDLHLIHGNENVARRLCEATDAAWRFLGDPCSRAAVSLEIGGCALMIPRGPNKYMYA